MSSHCVFCGNPEVWMRGKERPKDSRMVDFKVYRECSSKKILEFVCHADCLRLVLKNGQDRYMKDGVLYEFKELIKEAKR